MEHQFAAIKISKLILQKLIFTGFFFLFTTISFVYAESDTLEETISSGNRMYDRFCSICHGANARGEGPFTSNLVMVPPDLTILSRNNGGTFPWIQTYEVIDGKNKPQAHGSTDMPIWGETFDLRNWGNSYAEYADVIVRGRIFELMVYLQSIQE